MEVVIDSHALLWYLSGNAKLSTNAKHTIEKATSVVIPSIVVMEILYILEKNKFTYKFLELLTELKTRSYRVYPLDLNIVVQTLFVDGSLEMHDRIIIATAQMLDAPLITKDRQITQHYSKSIW